MGRRPDLNKIVTRRMAERGLNRHALHEQVERSGHKCSPQTVYNFVAGKPIRSDHLAAILAVLDLTITEAK